MMPQFAQMSSTTNSLSQNVLSKETTEEPVEIDPVVAEKINLHCKNIILEYEQMHNLDVNIRFNPIYFYI